MKHDVASAQAWSSLIRRDAHGSDRVISAIYTASEDTDAVNVGGVINACASIIARIITDAGEGPRSGVVRAGILALIDGYAMELATCADDHAT